MLFVSNPVRPITPNILDLEFFDIPETKSEEESQEEEESKPQEPNFNQLQILVLENIQNLNQEQIQWSQELLQKCPELIEEIHKDIQTILSDEGQIDFHDIPVMIKIISEIIHHKAIFSELLHPKNILTFIKYILDIIVDYDFFIPNYVDKNSIKSMVDSSMDLLAYHILPIQEVKEIESCCFSNLFTPFFTPFFISNTKKTI